METIHVLPLYFSYPHKKVFDTLKELNMLDQPNVITIDAGRDNKPSASNA